MHRSIVIFKFVFISDKVGIRIPNHDFVRTVVKSLGCPIALTSANISNEPSAVQIGEFKSLWNKLSCVVDGGCLSSNRSGSTVVDLSEPGFYKIIRSGMAHENTCKLLRKYRLVERCWVIIVNGSLVSKKLLLTLLNGMSRDHYLLFLRWSRGAEGCK